MLYRIMAQYEVQLVNESLHEFYVAFTGPKESIPPYSHALDWRL